MDLVFREFNQITYKQTCSVISSVRDSKVLPVLLAKWYWGYRCTTTASKSHYYQMLLHQLSHSPSGRAGNRPICCCSLTYKSYVSRFNRECFQIEKKSWYKTRPTRIEIIPWLVAMVRRRLELQQDRPSTPVALADHNSYNKWDMKIPSTLLYV